MKDSTDADNMEDSKEELEDVLEGMESKEDEAFYKKEEEAAKLSEATVKGEAKVASAMEKNSAVKSQLEDDKVSGAIDEAAYLLKTEKIAAAAAKVEALKAKLEVAKKMTK